MLPRLILYCFNITDYVPHRASPCLCLCLQSIFAEIEEHIRAMELQYIEANIRAQTQFQRTHSQLLQAAQLGSCTDPEQTIIEDGLQMQEEVLGLQAQIAAFEEDLDLLLLRSDKL